VFAVDEVGPGRVVFSGDANVVNLEVTTCPLYEWLGDTPDLPNLAAVGSESGCNGIANDIENYPIFTYLGLNLPVEYLGAPEALAAAYDVVVYCPLRPNDDVATSPGTAETLVDFVAQEGGGLYMVAEYYPAGLDDVGFGDLNAIANALGANFLKTSLEPGEGSGDLAIDCVDPGG
jgi:hypothetical protein